MSLPAAVAIGRAITDGFAGGLSCCAQHYSSMAIFVQGSPPAEVAIGGAIADGLAGAELAIRGACKGQGAEGEAPSSATGSASSLHPSRRICQGGDERSGQRLWSLYAYGACCVTLQVGMSSSLLLLLLLLPAALSIQCVKRSTLWSHLFSCNLEVPDK